MTLITYLRHFNPPAVAIYAAAGVRKQGSMAKKSKSKPDARPKATVPNGLKDMNIHVNEFGEVVKDYNIDAINAFLKERVPDKKLTED